MSNFLDVLADQISSQFSLGENTNHTLDSIDPVSGKQEKYGSLGDFAKHFDQSSERRYVEQGYLRRDPYNMDPKQFEVLFQEPSATILVKKKMFSSIGQNFRPDYMDKDEILYFKALRILFKNKCDQIATLEKLSKIQKITSSVGNVSDQLMPIIFTLTDSLSSGLSSGANLFGALGGGNPLASGANKLTQSIDRVRRLYAFNNTNNFTTWLQDNTNLYETYLGTGSGVIEITNFSSFNTSVSTDFNNGGSFDLTIQDPYEAMVISEYDIEQAISDATNMFYNYKIFQFGKTQSDKLISDLKARLNRVRAARGAGSISIKVDPDTLLGRRVTAIFDRVAEEIIFTYDSTSAESIFSGGAFGGGVTIEPGFLRGGDFVGEEGLDPQKVTYKFVDSNNTHRGPDSEVDIFNRLISTIYSKLSMDANSQNSLQTMNSNTNYTRKKLRFNFLGRLIIQPMDVIHFYANTKSRYDIKLLSGLQSMFTGLGTLQNLNNTLTGIKNSFDTIFNPSGSLPFQAEKTAFVGGDFPNYLWAMMRDNFVTEREGAHIFAGVVTAPRGSYNNGKYMVSVSGKDNSYYFEQGKINFIPGVDNFTGKMFDPLTPFKSTWDTVATSPKSDTPVLLEENQALLGFDGKNSILKSKLGRYAGMAIKDGKNVIHDMSIDPLTGRVTKTFYAPDGLVYKWKEGIGVFTQFGSNLDMNGPDRAGNPNLAKEPFAGQDIMNVLSLLITGHPYNFATYFKATQKIDGAMTDPITNQGAAHSFSMSLRSDLAKSNSLWGNFIPFKNLVLDDQSYVVAMSTLSSITNNNSLISQKMNKLRELNQAKMWYGAANFVSNSQNIDEKLQVNNGDINNIDNKITLISNEIKSHIEAVNKENDNFRNITGEDITDEASEYIDPKKLGLKESKDLGNTAKRKFLRRQLNFLTRRMSYNVRSNDDKNLFIVDDTYDKDMDIMAFNQQLSNPQLYNSDFTNTKDKINIVKDLLNLEVFCDTQGHVRCRAPQYNRMPSSVFYRMMQLKQTLGIQIFPKFLDDLFNRNLDALRSKIELLEDQIRLQCAILDPTIASYDDVTLDTDALSAYLIIENGPSGGSFEFLSNTSGTIVDIQQLMLAASPDNKIKANSLASAAETFTKLQTTLSTKKPFNGTEKYTILNRAVTKQNLDKDGTPAIYSENLQESTIIDTLCKRIYQKSGQRVYKDDYLVKDSTGDIGLEVPIGLKIDTFKIANEISEKLRERQRAVSVFYKTLINAVEFKSLDTGDEIANKLLSPGQFGRIEVPEVFEHMIEDESYDDYGFGSGSRYIIKRPQIHSLTIYEEPPAFNAIEIQGILNSYNPNGIPPGLNPFPGGGNGMVTAMAIDYDLWRNYGYRQGPPIQVPFLNNPENQCAPYAAILLARNRANILHGSLTISGNEFMQPGEVIFIEDRQLLFYVNSVKHSFDYNGKFTTSLELSYGHSPGEYIPTVSDMIGKMIYNNKDSAEVIVQRQETSANEINLGVLQLPPNTKSYNLDKSIGLDNKGDASANSFASSNAKTLNNILYQVAHKLNSYNGSVTDSNFVPKVELRIYIDDGKFNNAPADLLTFVEDVKDILLGDNAEALNTIVSSKGVSVPTINKKDNLLLDDQINLDDTTDRRSPSQAALSAARNMMNMKKMGDTGSALNDNSTSTGDDSDPSQINYKQYNNKIKTALCKYIVDCWLVLYNKSEAICND